MLIQLSRPVHLLSGHFSGFGMLTPFRAAKYFMTSSVFIRQVDYNSAYLVVKRQNLLSRKTEVFSESPKGVLVGLGRTTPGLDAFAWFLDWADAGH